jgi:hypothetical protein
MIGVLHCERARRCSVELCLQDVPFYVSEGVCRHGQHGNRNIRIRILLARHERRMEQIHEEIAGVQHRHEGHYFQETDLLPLSLRDQDHGIVSRGI